jgi:phosphinothricin acetyltransferase
MASIVRLDPTRVLVSVVHGGDRVASPARLPSGDESHGANPMHDTARDRIDARAAEPSARVATARDAAAIAAIYSEGIEDRIATFETRPRTASDVAAWFDGRHPIVVVVDSAGAIVGFAATFEYRPRAAYARVAEFSVYVARAQRGRGIGRLAMTALIEAAAEAGLWKLVSRVFVDNEASRRLLADVGFREVGIYRRHGRLDGHWRDVVIVERLLPLTLEDNPSGS